MEANGQILKRRQVNILLVILFKFSNAVEFGDFETLFLKLDMNIYNY